MGRLRWFELHYSFHEIVARGLFIVDNYTFVAGDDVAVFVVAHEQVLKLVLVHELSRAVVLDEEESGVRHSLGRRQEFALIFNILAVFDPRGRRLFVVDSLDHLVKVEGHGQLLGRITIGVDDEMIALLIGRPDASLLQVGSVNTGSSLVRHTKELKEVVIVVDSKLHLFADAVEEGALTSRNHDDLPILAHLYHTEVISLDQMDQASRELVVARQLLLLHVRLNDTLVRQVCL